MSLLIKGLDMPKLNENAEHLWVPGWIEVGKDGKAIFCTGTHFDPNTIRSYPIEEVTTPHGRLIDCERDFFPTAFRHNLTDYAKGWNTCLRSVLLSPTIIEAEVSG